MRRIADLHAGVAKTDARDAAIVAEAARSMPHALRSLRLDDEELHEHGEFAPHAEWELRRFIISINDFYRRQAVE